jgi:hypothetical protein
MENNKIMPSGYVIQNVLISGVLIPSGQLCPLPHIK